MCWPGWALLHPDGLNLVDSLGPANALKRAVRRRVKLVEYQLASRQRLDSMLDLLGPGYAEAMERTCSVVCINRR